MSLEPSSRSPWTLRATMLVAIALLGTPAPVAALTLSSVLREARANVEFFQDSSYDAPYSYYYPDSQASNAPSGYLELSAESTYNYRAGTVAGRSRLESMIDGGTISFDSHVEANSDGYYDYSPGEFEDYFYEERVTGSGSTRIDIRFELDEWSDWSLSLATSGSLRSTHNYGSAQLLREFESGPDDVIFAFDIPRSLNADLVESGFLAPGSYRFIYTQSAGSGPLGQSVVGEFSVVPEPGTALLLGVGLVGLASRRRRRHRRVADD